MTYEEMMQMIGQGTDTGNLQDQIAMQLKRAEALRQDNIPQMRNAGRVQVAPHPLELLGGLAKEYSAQNLQDKAQASQKDIRMKQQEQFAMLLRQLAQPQQQTAGPGLMPPRPPMGVQMPEQ